MKEQKSANGIQFISLEEYALQNPGAVSFIHSREKQFYYSYVSVDLQKPAVLHEGEKRKEYVASIKDAVCFSESEVIMLDERYAYHEFKTVSCLRGIADCCDYRILVKDTPEKYEIKLPRKRANLTKGVFLSGLYSENYYHFVFSIIAKTELLSLVPMDVPLLVDNNVKKFESYQKLLEICNTDGREIIFLDSNVCYHVANLYLISFPFFLAPNVYSGVVDKPQYTQLDIEALQKFRNRILASFEKKSEWPKRIFLSRKNASFRRPFNEFECQEILKTYGFEVIYPEELSFEQQVLLFHNAEMIAGGSGAAFTNLLYCSEGCQIFTFIGYKISMSFWQPIVCFNNGRFYRISDRSKGELTQDNHPYDIHNPFYIDPDDIRELMSRLGIQKEEVSPKSLSKDETVTVSVLTYNSSKTVVETLESIKAQSYPYLNLTICDDFSSDDTIKVCKKWIEENRDRFQNVKVATSFQNFGVAFNCNRSLDLCETRYLKEIAGDDLLEKDCIRQFLQYAKSDSVPAIYFSKVKIIGESSSVKNYANLFDYKFFTLDSREQTEKLIYSQNFIPAASAFYNVDKLRQMKLRNDERIPALEDWPKWINYLKKGGRLGFLDKVLVGYRVGGGVSTNIDLQNKFLISNLKFELLYRAPTIMTCDEKTIDGYVNKLFFQLFRGNQMIELHKRNRKHLKIMQKLVYLSVGFFMIILYLLFQLLK